MGRALWSYPFPRDTSVRLSEGDLSERGLLGGPRGRRVGTGLVVDTGDSESVGRLVASSNARLSQIDILVNNAAVPGGISPATRLDQVVDEQVLQDIDIEVVGYLRSARALAPHLIQNGWGRIINIGGLAIHRTGRPVATLRNVGVAAITMRLADELGLKGINVVAVHPGGCAPSAPIRRRRELWPRMLPSAASSMRPRSRGWSPSWHRP